MRRRLARAALAGALLSAAGARAWVHSTTSRGTALHWGGSCAFVVPDQSPPPGLTQEAVVATIGRAVANWQAPTRDQGTSYLRLEVSPAAAIEAQDDGRNAVKFRQDEWCRPAEPGHPKLCFSRLVSGITTVFYLNRPGDPQDGQITDADVELNAVDFTFVNQPSTVAPRPGTHLADLENTLTHELGHLQGLAHTCWESAAGTPQPNDDQGRPVPDCGALAALPADEAARITGATMYNFASWGETSKRTAQPDDIAAINALYPAARDPRQCAAAGAGGCGSFGAGSPAGGLLELLSALLVAWRLRRRGL